jgi:retinol dehydrogenase 12
MVQKKVIISGATDGIGLITARRLAETGAEIGLIARNPEKGACVVDQLQRETGNDAIHFFKADLSKFDEVRVVANEVQTVFPTLDILINNAGAMFMGRELSEDGYEMTFALNHLSVFLLTNLLMPNLSLSDKARIVTVASVAHRGSDLDFDDLDGQKGRYSGWRAYQRSKLANILFTRELAKRLGNGSATANCLHPGFVASRFGENNGLAMTLFFKAGKVFAISPEKGAETSVFLATSENVEGKTGGYYTRKRLTKPSRQAQNDTTAQQLWERSAEITGVDL